MSTIENLDLSEPYLLGWLSSVGLDVEYVRGERNTLYRRGAGGEEIPVLDFAGGYGSLILGHNHPEIVAYAQELLAVQTPIHAQFSRHPYASSVAAALNGIIQREVGSDEPYSVIFGNSGAEAVEAAIKHAELERVSRVAALTTKIDERIDTARDAVRAGALVRHDQALPTDFEELVVELRRRNAAVTGRAPLYLAFEGSFHGKLAGSVQLTHNPAYRTPFSAMAAQARFVPFNQPGQVETITESERATLLALELDGGVVRVVEHDFPVFAAFLLEPVQGEGGIREVDAVSAAEIQRVCAALDIPVIVDEIQSGMGRCGAFLASSQIGLRGDYYTLAKSLGGGVAKVSALLVRRSRYQSDFELVHSSTFAKDSFSCHIALKTLDLLDAHGGRSYRIAAELGAELTTRLTALKADYPDVIVDVRGRGLMLGLEYRDQSEASSPAIRQHAPFLGYAIAGYLLQAHNIRTFPTASAITTLRFEPSIYLTEVEMDRLATALRDTCEILRKQPENGFAD